MTSIQPGAPAKHLSPIRSMRIALLTPGPVSAGAEPDTTLEEIGGRLLHEGHRVTVFGARTDRRRTPQRGRVQPRHPAAPTSSGIGQAMMAAARLAASRAHDVVLVFGAANAPLIPLLRAHGAAVGLRVDGLEWKRRDLGPWGRRYHRAAERLAVREADALITGSPALQEYFEDEFGLQTELVGAGSLILRRTPCDLIEDIGLVPRAFHLAVAAPALEHETAMIADAHRRSGARLPLVVIGSASTVLPDDGRLRLLRGPLEPRLLDQLYAHAADLVHGGTTGGSQHAVLRAMGAGTPVLGYDVVFNREVAGTGGLYFDGPAQLGRQLEEVERYPLRFAELGDLMRERARQRHDWDQVTEGYERLASKLTKGFSTRGMSTGGRLGSHSVWSAGRSAPERGA